MLGGACSRDLYWIFQKLILSQNRQSVNKIICSSKEINLKLSVITTAYSFFSLMKILSFPPPLPPKPHPLDIIGCRKFTKHWCSKQFLHKLLAAAHQLCSLPSYGCWTALSIPFTVVETNSIHNVISFFPPTVFLIHWLAGVVRVSEEDLLSFRWHLFHGAVRALHSA